MNEMTGAGVSLTTDFMSQTGLADDALELTAAAGFTHIHWCHHWNDDFIYTEPEIEHIKASLEKFGLKLSDTHGSHSNSGEKCWFSTNETYRRAGVELVKNRIDFTAALGGDAVIVHGPPVSNDDSLFGARVAALNKSLDELEARSRDKGIRLAIENSNDNYDNLLLPVILPRPSDYLGFCYDCGHHNMRLKGETRESRARRDAWRNELAERLTITHLQDNDGVGDCHWIPFTGEMDWDDVIGFIKRANYAKPLNLEVSYGNMSKRDSTLSPAEFARRAYAAAAKLAGMLKNA